MKFRSPAYLLTPLLCALAALAGCSFDSSSNQARGCKECPPGQCYLGYCLSRSGITGLGPDAQAPETDAKVATNANTGGSGGAVMTGVPNRSDGGGGTGPDAGGSVPPPGPCAAGGACYLGPAATRGKGSCHDGVAQCDGSTTTACMGQTLPSSELCNAADDDCDGKVDEDVMLGSCSAPGMGDCGTGALQCQAGSMVCVANAQPTPEVCNGLDDDCDGVVDNVADVPCYPASTLGCTQNPDGSFACKGQCKAGTEACVGGKLQACAGAVVPTMEKCGGDQAVDEDCDGNVDNGCPCTGTQSQLCYSGPFLTNFFGVCKVGSQQCVNGVYGACQGEVTPSAETCANQGADNDCNGTVDDVAGVGQACVVSANLGVCRNGTLGCIKGQRVCVTPAAASTETKCDGIDEDCDGKVDEDFVLATDAANCGSCGNACTTGQLCCAGACRSVAQDPQYCGSCGQACVGGTACCNGVCCGASQICCSGMCVTTGTNSHCSGCNDSCQSGQACCAGGCTALGTHDRCSSCDDKCGTDQGCCGGTCKSTGTSTGCDTNQTCCDEGCVAANTNAHCMACMACATNQTCCGTSCSDLKTDAQHCGSCDKACSSACPMCVNGACTDPMGMATCP